MVAAGGDQDVVRLDVAVDQAGLVRGVERVTRLGEDAQRPADVQLPRDDQVLQVRPPDEPHREEEPVLALARLVDRDDVRVLERGLEETLAAEALAERRLAAELGGDHLERDGAREGQLGRLVDGAHAAAADQGVDAIPLDDVADLEHRPGLYAASQEAVHPVVGDDRRHAVGGLWRRRRWRLAAAVAAGGGGGRRCAAAVAGGGGGGGGGGAAAVVVRSGGTGAAIGSVATFGDSCGRTTIVAVAFGAAGSSESPPVEEPIR